MESEKEIHVSKTILNKSTNSNMSKNAPKRNVEQPKSRVATTASTTTTTTATRTKTASAPPMPLLFGKGEFKWMLIGLGLIFLGMILMLGGSMPNPDTWDPSIIYSPMRISVAPILILAGLVLQIFAIFHKTKPSDIVASEE